MLDILYDIILLLILNYLLQNWQITSIFYIQILSLLQNLLLSYLLLIVSIVDLKVVANYMYHIQIFPLLILIINYFLIFLHNSYHFMIFFIDFLYLFMLIIFVVLLNVFVVLFDVIFLKIVDNNHKILIITIF